MLTLTQWITNKKISKSAKQYNYIETKPISQQLKDLLIEELKKKRKTNIS